MIKTRTALPWALSALLAASTLWLGQAYFVSRTESRLLRDHQELSNLALRTSEAQLASERILSRGLMGRAAATSNEGRSKDRQPVQAATLLPSQPGAERAWAVVAWDPVRKEGICVAANLPATDQAYSLWVLTEKPVQVGTFQSGEDGRARIQFGMPWEMQKAFRFAISRGADPNAWVLASD